MALRWSDADKSKVLQDHGDWLALAPGEEIQFAAKTVRDLLIMTNRRLVRTDTQGIMNRKTEYQSIPFKSIARWSVETKGRGWADGADLKVWVGSAPEPLLNIELHKDESAREVAALLSAHILGG